MLADTTVDRSTSSIFVDTDNRYIQQVIIELLSRMSGKKGANNDNED